MVEDIGDSIRKLKISILSSTKNNRTHESITNGHLLFVMGALILQRAPKCEVRQVTKDVVKSEV